VRLEVFTVMFGQLSFEQMVEKVRSLGLDYIEIGTGAYPGKRIATLTHSLPPRSGCGIRGMPALPPGRPSVLSPARATGCITRKERFSTVSDGDMG
jgi:hypothetical protein